MRKIFPLILLLTISASSAVAQSGRRITKPAPTPVEPVVESASSPETEEPSLTVSELGALPQALLNRQLQSLDKGSFRLADFSGSIIVLNLWASWCGPCRREVPEYERVRKEFAGRGVEFVGLTTEDPRTSSERVKQFARDAKFGFRLAWADRETALTLMSGRSVIPQTLVIAPDGRIISHWRGYSPGQSGNRLRETIERALSEN